MLPFREARAHGLPVIRRPIAEKLPELSDERVEAERLTPFAVFAEGVHESRAVAGHQRTD